MTSSHSSSPAPPSDDPNASVSNMRSSRLFGKKIPLIDTDQIPLNVPLEPPANAAKSRLSEPPQRLDPLVRRILNRLPSDVAATFTERQLYCLNQALVNPSKHSVDVRRTISFLFLRYYFVILAGPERRAPDRVKQSRRPWSVRRTALLTLLVAALGLTLYQAIYRRSLEAPAPKVIPQQEGVHPTALPWIKTQEQCKGGDRQWKNGLCYDSSHSPEF